MITVSTYTKMIHNEEQIITKISGINPDIYDLSKVKYALKDIFGIEKIKITTSNDILLLGEFDEECRDFITKIGF